MLYETVREIDVRVDTQGRVLRELVPDILRTVLIGLREQGIRSLAVVLMHAYRFPDHEQRIGALAEELGFEQVSLSHQVSPLIRFIGRGDTTVVDAYLSPVLRRHADRLAGHLEGISLSFMKS